MLVRRAATRCAKVTGRTGSSLSNSALALEVEATGSAACAATEVVAAIAIHMARKAVRVRAVPICVAVGIAVLTVTRIVAGRATLDQDGAYRPMSDSRKFKYAVPDDLEIS